MLLGPHRISEGQRLNVRSHTAWNNVQSWHSCHILTAKWQPSLILQLSVMMFGTNSPLLCLNCQIPPLPRSAREHCLEGLLTHVPGQSLMQLRGWTSCHIKVSEIQERLGKWPQTLTLNVLVRISPNIRRVFNQELLYGVSVTSYSPCWWGRDFCPIVTGWLNTCYPTLDR